jgi:hypothetical protein
MAIKQAVLLIADIGGYTRFMTLHRINLAHAQDVVAQLLEAVIDAAPGFELAKLEGDAAFFYAPMPGGDARKLGAQVTEIRRAFLERRAELELDRLCSCDGCVQAAQLKLKFVAHVGEVAEQKVKHLRELAGVSVITVHRMLKNSVPLPEYVLMTEPLYRALSPELQPLAQAQPEELEGIGEVGTYYIDLSRIDAQPVVRKTNLWRKLWAWVRTNVRSMPYVVGAKTACEGFRNLGDVLPDAQQPAQLPELRPPEA